MTVFVPLLLQYHWLLILHLFLLVPMVTGFRTLNVLDPFVTDFAPLQILYPSFFLSVTQGRFVSICLSVTNTYLLPD